MVTRFRRNSVADGNSCDAKAIRLRQRLMMAIVALAVIAPALFYQRDLSVAALMLFLCCIVLTCLLSVRCEREARHRGAPLQFERLSTILEPSPSNR